MTLYNINWAPTTLELLEEIIKGLGSMDMHVETLETLKDAVVRQLVTVHDFIMEEAEEAVESSVEKDTGMWNVNASPEDIAKYLASDENDE